MLGSLYIDPWKFGDSYWKPSFLGAMLVSGRVVVLGGGNSKISYVHPENWGNDPIWLVFFRWVETAN